MDARLLVDTLRLTANRTVGESDSQTGAAAPAGADALVAAWSRADVGALVRLAEYEGAALWLRRRLRTLGVTFGGEAGERLSSVATRLVAHTLRVDTETSSALDTLDAAGIQVVLLKGAAMRRLASRVPYADARAPKDIDLLVREDAAQRAWDALVAAGYSVPPPVTTPHHHHLPALVGTTGVSVELHVTTTASVAPAEAWRRATCDGATADVDGTWRLVPSDTELLWHAATHALVSTEEIVRDGLRLRYWLDASALLAASAEIDWARIRARLDESEIVRRPLAHAWFGVASQLAGRPLPAGALAKRGGASSLNVERLLSWRIRVLARHASSSRWAERLMEEGARGEAKMALEPARATASLGARMRHGIAARAARLCWRVLQ